MFSYSEQIQVSRIGLWDSLVTALVPAPKQYWQWHDSYKRSSAQSYL